MAAEKIKCNVVCSTSFINSPLVYNSVIYHCYMVQQREDIVNSFKIFALKNWHFSIFPVLRSEKTEVSRFG